MATLLRAHPPRVQSITPFDGRHAFTWADVEAIVFGPGALRVRRVRITLGPRVFEVLIHREADPTAPINVLANAILVAAGVPLTHPIRGDAVHCYHVRGAHVDEDAYT